LKFLGLRSPGAAEIVFPNSDAFLPHAFGIASVSIIRSIQTEVGHFTLQAVGVARLHRQSPVQPADSLWVMSFQKI
jgi:hypothetical protein